MARGFESKAVADQQESVQAPRPQPEATANPALATRRRRLELARSDLERRLAAATAVAHRQMLERALAAVAEDLEALSGESA